MAKGNKGPADGIIRQASGDDLDRAFGDDGGSVPRNERSPGGRGNTRGIRLVLPGAEGAEGDVEVAPDPCVLRNAAAREAKKRARYSQTGQTVAGTQMTERTVQANAPELEDWELEAAAAEPVPPLAPEPQRAPHSPSPFPGSGNAGDMLEQARRRALQTLAALPQGCELYVGDGLGPAGVELVMGIGYLIGAKLAAYRGNGHYVINEAGRLAAASEQE